MEKTIKTSRIPTAQISGQGSCEKDEDCHMSKGIEVKSDKSRLRACLECSKSARDVNFPIKNSREKWGISHVIGR